jgi:hypothetical protein
MILMRSRSTPPARIAPESGSYALCVATAILVAACGQQAAPPATATERPPAARPSEVQQPAAKGPFGLAAGMNEDSVRKATRQFSAVASASGTGFFSATSVPRPHQSFESYLFRIGPTEGLCKIMAVGVDVEMNSFGKQLKEEFDRLVETLTEKYGAAESFDYLTRGSIWDEPEDWSMALAKQERTLAATWEFKPARAEDSVQNVLLEAKANSRSKGFVTLTYEFANHKGCLKELKKATTPVL